MTQKTTTKIVWILAGIGILLLALGTIVRSLELAALAGFYLAPLSLLYVVITLRNKRVNLTGLIFGIVFLIWDFAGNAIFTTCTDGPCPSDMMTTFFLILGWPSIVLLIASAYSIVKKR